MTDLLEGLRPHVRSAIETKGLLNDPVIADTLGRMTDESRRQVLHRIGSLGMEWADASVDAEFVEDDLTEGDERLDANPNRLVMSVRRDSLTPNKFNAGLFPDSLSGESIEVLAESLKSGQRVPIEITNSYEILNGERRWRAAELAGMEMVDVIIVGDLSDDEILDRVLDSCTSTRQPSPREKALIYKALYQRLQATLGRKHGERSSDENLLSPMELKKLAIKRARISSVMMAERLMAIFSKAPLEIQEKVNSGEMSVAAGYEEIPKTPRKAGEDRKPGNNDITDVTVEGVWVNPFASRGRLADGTIVPQDEIVTGETEPSRVASPATSVEAHAVEKSDDPEVEEGRPGASDDLEVRDDACVVQKSDNEEAMENPSGTSDNLEARDGESQERTEDRTDGHEQDDSPGQNAGEADHSSSVDEALEVLAQHLEELVAEAADLTSAKAEIQVWLKWLFDRAKAARDLAA